MSCFEVIRLVVLGMMILVHSFVPPAITPRHLYQRHVENRASAFDQGFAESISKPLPQWYLEANLERERLMREVEQNRDRILADFRAKYEVSAIEKLAERQKQLASVKERLLQKGKEQRSGWWARLRGRAKVASTDIEVTAEEVLSTKEKWDTFWREEEEQTGFYLPGLLEVFPELNFKWPKWSRRQDGTAVECEADQDCPFPQACCPHPIVPGVSFCCTGWGQRVMIPQYAFQPLRPDAPTDATTDNARRK
jgi:hypothetical protein